MLSVRGSGVHELEVDTGFEFGPSNRIDWKLFMQQTETRDNGYPTRGCPLYNRHVARLESHHTYRACHAHNGCPGLWSSLRHASSGASHLSSIRGLLLVPVDISARRDNDVKRSLESPPAIRAPQKHSVKEAILNPKRMQSPRPTLQVYSYLQIPNGFLCIPSALLLILLCPCVPSWSRSQRKWSTS